MKVSLISAFVVVQAIVSAIFAGSGRGPVKGWKSCVVVYINKARGRAKNYKPLFVG